jgi:hypothetical protein
LLVTSCFCVLADDNGLQLDALWDKWWSKTVWECRVLGTSRRVIDPSHAALLGAGCCD